MKKMNTEFGDRGRTPRSTSPQDLNDTLTQVLVRLHVFCVCMYRVVMKTLTDEGILNLKVGSTIPCVCVVEYIKL